MVGIGQIKNGRYALRVMPGQSIYLSYEVDVDGERYRGRYNPPIRPTPPTPGRRVASLGTTAVQPATSAVTADRPTGFYFVTEPGPLVVNITVSLG